MDTDHDGRHAKPLLVQLASVEVRKTDDAWPVPLSSYTYASAIDEAGAYDAGTQPQYLDNLPPNVALRADWPPSLHWTNVYTLPVGRGRQIGSHWNRVTDAFIGGWQISNILSDRTGLPINVSLAAHGN